MKLSDEKLWVGLVFGVLFLSAIPIIYNTYYGQFSTGSTYLIEQQLTINYSAKIEPSNYVVVTLWTDQGDILVDVIRELRYSSFHRNYLNTDIVIDTRGVELVFEISDDINRLFFRIYNHQTTNVGENSVAIIFEYLENIPTLFVIELDGDMIPINPSHMLGFLVPLLAIILFEVVNYLGLLNSQSSKKESSNAPQDLNDPENQTSDPKDSESISSNGKSSEEDLNMYPQVNASSTQQPQVSRRVDIKIQDMYDQRVAIPIVGLVLWFLSIIGALSIFIGIFYFTPILFIAAIALYVMGTFFTNTMVLGREMILSQSKEKTLLFISMTIGISIAVLFFSQIIYSNLEYFVFGGIALNVVALLVVYRRWWYAIFMVINQSLGKFFWILMLFVIVGNVVY